MLDTEIFSVRHYTGNLGGDIIFCLDLFVFFSRLFSSFVPIFHLPSFLPKRFSFTLLYVCWQALCLFDVSG